MEIFDQEYNKQHIQIYDSHNPTKFTFSTHPWHKVHHINLETRSFRMQMPVKAISQAYDIVKVEFALYRLTNLRPNLLNYRLRRNCCEF